jgi:hypothetical protein
VAMNVTWNPCPETAASMQFVGMVHHEPALVINQGADRLILVPPRDRDDWPQFIRLLREIRDSADEMCAFLDFTIPGTAKGGERREQTT